MFDSRFWFITRIREQLGSNTKSKTRFMKSKNLKMTIDVK